MKRVVIVRSSLTVTKEGKEFSAKVSASYLAAGVNMLPVPDGAFSCRKWVLDVGVPVGEITE